ncbi:MAG: hypothetical protein K0S44_813 [Bacteroidetes bacterium]|jgi:hypothetical protein|nr:hypothetical protein [Bacteroidota bacterium]
MKKAAIFAAFFMILRVFVCFDFENYDFISSHYSKQDALPSREGLGVCSFSFFFLELHSTSLQGLFALSNLTEELTLTFYLDEKSYEKIKARKSLPASANQY